MDRFVRDSDILARLPEGMLLLGPAAGLFSFNATAETLLGMPLERLPRGAHPVVGRPRSRWPVATSALAAIAPGGGGDHRSRSR